MPQKAKLEILQKDAKLGAQMSHNKKLKKKKITKVIKEFEKGELHSGSKKGPVVTSKDQALAIGYSEAKKKNKNKK